MATTTSGAIKVGDTVRVTRRTGDGATYAWEGGILAGDATTGFELRGVCLATGRPEHSWFDGAEQLELLYGCVQTVTLVR